MSSLGRCGGRLNSWGGGLVGVWREGERGGYFKEVGEAGLGEVDVGVGGIFGLWRGGLVMAVVLFASGYSPLSILIHRLA